jgi:hypothetical protein
MRAAVIRSPDEALRVFTAHNNREARAGTAIALALGGTANLQPGGRFALSAGYGNFQGSNALGVGATGCFTTAKAAPWSSTPAWGSAWTRM